MAIPYFDVTIKGVALLTQGLTEGNVTDGLGLETKGLIWGCGNIWYFYYGVSIMPTAWTLYPYAGVSTGWTIYPYGVSISTTWTPYSSNLIEDC